MNKSELIQALSEECGVAPEEAVTIVDTFFDSIRETLLANGRVELRGFGSFQMKEYKGYRGRNPKTGQSVLVQPKSMPFFKAGKGLKEFLNE
jgi:integration host factor subunit beta